MKGLLQLCNKFENNVARYSMFNNLNMQPALFGANVKLLKTLTCRVNGTFTSPIENLCPETVQIETAQ